MDFNFEVFNKPVSRTKRGTKAESMLPCPRCDEHTGVFIEERSRQDFEGKSKGKPFSLIIWEHWSCLGCGLHWTEKYGVSKNGVAPEIFLRLSKGVKDGNSS